MICTWITYVKNAGYLAGVLGESVKITNYVTDVIE